MGQILRYLNVRTETLKFEGENTGKISLTFDLGNDFLHTTPTAQAKRRINKWDYIKLKCSAQRKKQSAE